MTFGSPGSSPQFGGPRPGAGSGYNTGPNNADSGFGFPSSPNFGSPNQAGGTAPSFGAAGPAQGSQGFGAPGGQPSAPRSSRPATPAAPTKGPWPLLIAAGVAAILSAIVVIAAPLVSTATQGLFFGLAITGWVLAGIVAFVLLGLYTLQNTRRQAESFYIEDTRQTLVYRLVMISGFVLVVASAVEIAFYVGKVMGA
ncbi:hypothetical protein ACWWUQ_00860 [Corynebacterium striatum]